MSFTGGAVPCAVCGKRVYGAERADADGQTFHKACMRCAECNCVVKLGSYAALGGKFYCKPHFRQLFARSGNYHGAFQGQTDPKAKWLSLSTNCISNNTPSSVAALTSPRVTPPRATINGVRRGGSFIREAEDQYSPSQQARKSLDPDAPPRDSTEVKQSAFEKVNKPQFNNAPARALGSRSALIGQNKKSIDEEASTTQLPIESSSSTPAEAAPTEQHPDANKPEIDIKKTDEQPLIASGPSTTEADTQQDSINAVQSALGDSSTAPLVEERASTEEASTSAEKTSPITHSDIKEEDAKSADAENPSPSEQQHTDNVTVEIPKACLVLPTVRQRAESAPNATPSNDETSPTEAAPQPTVTATVENQSTTSAPSEPSRPGRVRDLTIRFAQRPNAENEKSDSLESLKKEGHFKSIRDRWQFGQFSIPAYKSSA